MHMGIQLVRCGRIAVEEMCVAVCGQRGGRDGMSVKLLFGGKAKLACCVVNANEMDCNAVLIGLTWTKRRKPCKDGAVGRRGMIETRWGDAPSSRGPEAFSRAWRIDSRGCVRPCGGDYSSATHSYLTHYFSETKVRLDNCLRGCGFLKLYLCTRTLGFRNVEPSDLAKMLYFSAWILDVTIRAYL